MKRYRFLNFFIDGTRGRFHGNVTAEMKEQMKQEERSRFEKKYGAQQFDAKFERWLAIPKTPLSVVGEHTYLLEDIEGAYVTGSLYSALTGACCLGERVFNQIILRTRSYYSGHEMYKRVYRTKSINDWDLAIDILRQWDIIGGKTEAKYRELYKLRTETVHFQSKQQDLERMAKSGIDLINGIIADLFGIVPENKFVSWCEVPGEMYLRKEYEEVPLVKEFYISGNARVGYRHAIVSTPDHQMALQDPYGYPDVEISDTEFVRLRKAYMGKE